MNPDQPNSYNPSQQPSSDIPAPIDPNQYPQIGLEPNPPLQPIPAKNSKKPLILGGIVLGVLVLLMIIGVIASSGNKPSKPEATTSNPSATSLSQVLEPANALTVELINDSIGQDIGALNDEQDLPTTKLDDKTLGL